MEGKGVCVSMCVYKKIVEGEREKEKMERIERERERQNRFQLERTDFNSPCSQDSASFTPLLSEDLMCEPDDVSPFLFQ